MAKNVTWLAMLAMVLAFGMMVVACDNGSTNGNDDGTTDDGEPLPVSSGANTLSGKTYFYYYPIVFSETAAGTANGTYTVIEIVLDNGDYGYPVLVNGKYTYRDIATGTYSWNENAKTVTLKPALVRDRDENRLLDRAGLRRSLQARLDDYRKEFGNSAFNQELAVFGFSSVVAYIDYVVNEAFANETYGYSFSTDGTALFLAEALPSNKGANELSGQTYFSNEQEYVFTASGFTRTDSFNGNVYSIVTGSYAYNEYYGKKRVWFKPETVDGKSRAEFFADINVPDEHGYVDDNAYRANETNEAFRTTCDDYYSTSKTIGS